MCGFKQGAFKMGGHLSGMSFKWEMPLSGTSFKRGEPMFKRIRVGPPKPPKSPKPPKPRTQIYLYIHIYTRRKMGAKAPILLETRIPERRTTTRSPGAAAEIQEAEAQGVRLKLST